MLDCHAGYVWEFLTARPADAGGCITSVEHMYPNHTVSYGLVSRKTTFLQKEAKITPEKLRNPDHAGKILTINNECMKL